MPFRHKKDQGRRAKRITVPLPKGLGEAKEAKAIARYMRMSPQKRALSQDLIRGKKIDDAITILDLNRKAMSKVMTKVLKSAVANAEKHEEHGRRQALRQDHLRGSWAYLEAHAAKAMGRGVFDKKEVEPHNHSFGRERIKGG